MPVKLTSLSYLGLAVETVLGTAVAPTAFIPIRKFTPQDTPTYVPDTGFRGQPVDTFGEYLGVISSTYALDGDVYPTSFGTLLANLFGVDTVTGTAAPYTHTLTTAAVPGSLTLSDYYVAGYRQWPGQKVEKLSLKFTPQAGLTHTTNLLGWPSATGTVPASETFGTNPFFLGWEASLTIAGVANPKLASFTLDLQRMKSAAVFSAQNSQKPFDIFVGPMAADWTLEYYMEDDTEYSTALVQGSQAVSVTLTQAGSGNSITFTSSAVQWVKPTIDRAGEYVLVSLDGKAIYNATDAGVAQAKIVNAIGTAYTTTAAS
ncbi:MAG: phage tail tube protein [Bacilli bacterium]